MTIYRIREGVELKRKDGSALCGPGHYFEIGTNQIGAFCAYFEGQMEGLIEIGSHGGAVQLPFPVTETSSPDRPITLFSENVAETPPDAPTAETPPSQATAETPPGTETEETPPQG